MDALPVPKLMFPTCCDGDDDDDAVSTAAEDDKDKEEEAESAADKLVSTMEGKETVDGGGDTGGSHDKDEGEDASSE